MKIELHYELCGAKATERKHKQVLERLDFRTNAIGTLTEIVTLQVNRWIVVRDQFYISSLISELLNENSLTIATVLGAKDLFWIRQIPSHKPGIYVELKLTLN